MLSLVLICAGLLTLPSVQTRLAGYLARMASEQTGTDIRIGRVSISLDGTVNLGDVFIGDLLGDTLFVVPDLGLKGVRFDQEKRLIQLSALELEGVRFNLAKTKGDTISNLTNLLNKIAGTDTTASGGDWTILCSHFNIEGLHFSFNDANSTVKPFGVDFEHIDIPDASMSGSRLSVIGDSIHTELGRFNFTDRSGFRVDELTGTATVSGHGVLVERMRLATPRSALNGKLQLISENWRSFNEFTQTVQMRLDLDSSELDMGDIAWFAPELEGIAFPMSISGKVRGTVSELKGRNLRVGFGERSYFHGNADLDGLPQIANTFMLLDIDGLRTSREDLHHLPVPPFTSKEMLQLPAEVDLLGDIDFAGRFTGFLHSFTAQGRATTALGDLGTDISYTRDTTTSNIVLSGRMATASFNLGALLGTSTIGALAANVKLNAKGKSLQTMKVDLDGDVPLFTINGRTITGITANGHLERDLFNGELHALSDELHLDFIGLADFRKRWPEVDFKAKLHHADLHALGFVKRTGYSALNADVYAKGRLSPDSLLGRLDMRGISYCDDDGEHDLGNLLLTSDRSNGMNTVKLDAAFAEAEVVGTFLPTKLPAVVQHVIYSVFPSLSADVSYKHAAQVFTYSVTTRDSDPWLALFLPDLRIASGSNMKGAFDSRSFDMDLTATIPQLVYRQVRIDSLELVTDKALDLLAFRARSSHQQIGDSLWFGGTAITGKAYQDELEFELGWITSNSGTHGDLELQGAVRGLKSIDLDLLPSDLYFGRGSWRNERTAHFTIDSTSIAVDSLILSNGDQRIALHGFVDKDPTRALAFDLQHVDLLNLEPMMSGPMLSGEVAGDGRIFDLYGAPYLISYMCADNVAVRDVLVGDVRFAATWLEGQGALDLNGSLTKGPIKALDFTGRMAVKDGNDLDMLLILDRFDLGLVNPYLPEGISDVGGAVTGNVALTGTLGDPQLNGQLEVENGGLRIDYLNTRYTFSDHVNIDPDMFTVDHATVHDQEGHSAKMGATIIHDKLTNWNYDIWGTMNNMMVLNTTVAQNDLYYGKAYATGDFGVSGARGALEINVDAATAAGTDVHFPVGGSTEISPIGFVQFGGVDSSATEEDLDLSGVSLDMKVKVTPDAHMELIFDPTVGDIMGGRGRGDLHMGVSQTGDFTMNGQVEVTEGDYLFTLRNVVNKKFQVVPGGHITWFGDPFDAQLDLQAIYKLRAPLYDIVPPGERTDAYKKPVPVDVVMDLRDKLMNPEIGFQVRLPSVDESIKAQVNSVISTDQERNRQVFALIVMKKFLPPPVYAGAGTPTGGNGVTAGGLATGSELLSNQVNNWLSSLSNDFNLGFNYRPGDNVTKDFVDVNLSTQLFNDRLVLTTNVGVQTGARANTSNNNNLIGDFQLDYLVSADGKFRVRAFSITNDRNLNQSDQAPTTQGAGISYRLEFDNWGTRWHDLLNVFRKPENEVHID
ncbi:MAG TPA: translocation/assembly module TamB domain-containing protein [Flavobacteriales bacterium]|nr:translocation/assembly module TamB domain-containing protein [Flavobacteriales bacterium]